MSKQDKKMVLSQIHRSELKGLLSLYEIGIAVKSSYSKKEIEAELKRRDKKLVNMKKQIDGIYNEAVTRFDSTLKKLED